MVFPPEVSGQEMKKSMQICNQCQDLGLIRRQNLQRLPHLAQLWQGAGQVSEDISKASFPLLAAGCTACLNEIASEDYTPEDVAGLLCAFVLPHSLLLEGLSTVSGLGSKA